MTPTAQDDVVYALYAALGRGDQDALAAALHPEFEADFAVGMPVGGGHARGPQEGRDHWWAIGAAYRVRPEVDEIVACADGRLLAVGTYRGTRRADDRPVEARFMHLWTLRDDRLARLEQITDTARW